MARVVVLPSLSDVLLFQDDDAACAFNEETQRNLLMRSPEPLPTPEERMSYAALFPPPIAEALGKRRRRAPAQQSVVPDVLLTMDELNDIAPVLEEEEAEDGDEDDDAKEAPPRVSTEPHARAPNKRTEPTTDSKRAYKDHVQRALEALDVPWLEAHALNVRQQPYEVYATSKFRTQVAGGSTVVLTTLRLAIYRAFLTNAQAEAGAEDAARVEDALSVIQTLVTRCGLNPGADAGGAETLLEFVSSKADAYAFENPERAERHPDGTRVDLVHVRVLRTLLRARADYLTANAPLCDALARLVEDKREACVLELLAERGAHLTDADVFDVVTRIMLYGTRPMLRRALETLDDDDRVPPTLCHPKTRSTLLHFAAKRDGALEALVRPYSDPARVDRRGHTAAHYSALRAV